jgi:Protein of unknown function (DUF4089)
MKAVEFRPDILIDALAPSFGLVLTSESRAQVVVHLRIAAEHAENLFSTPEDDRDEPAPVFTP